MRGQFTNLKETLATNLATNRGLPELLDQIKHYVRHLPHIGSPLPKTWVRVREALEGDAGNYISLDEYLGICRQHGFTKREDKLQLSDYLHCLGVCLHFQDDPLLNKTVILKPKWGTDAVYKVLDNPRIIAHQSRFTRTDLADIWREVEYADMQAELLQLMVNFKLCYKIKNSDAFIAPQLLTPNQPTYDWDEADNLLLRYTYEFMPKGILTQFIVATHGLIADQRRVWRSGVILSKDGAMAEVIEYYGKREITVRVAGKFRKELMTIVAYELDAIHAAYNRLKYDTLIPCNCAKCMGSQSPHFYKFDVLRQFMGDKQEMIQCQNSYRMVDICNLIDDVIDRRQALESGEGEAFGALGKERAGIVVEKVDKMFIQHTSEGANMLQQSEKGMNVMQQTMKGDNMMARRAEETVPVRSAWANGSFYLFTFAFVIAGLGVLARSVPGYALAAVLFAGIVFVPIIGALQLRQDDRLSEKGFLELMRLTIAQLPLIGKLGRAKGNPPETNPELPQPNQPTKKIPKKGS